MMLRVYETRHPLWRLPGFFMFPGMVLPEKKKTGREVLKRKKGKLNTSHRYDLLPLLPSGPGGVQRELVVYDLP